MKIVVTAGEVSEKGVWFEFCEMFGINEYAMKEGLLSSEEEFTLTEEQAVTLGFIEEKIDTRRW